MKNRKLFFIVLILFLILPEANLSFGQRGHHVVEKKLIERFKMAEPKFQKAKEFFIEGKYTKSERELRKCLEIMPEHANAHFLLSQINYKNGNFAQALADMEKAKANFDLISQLYNFTHEERLEHLREQKMNQETHLVTLQQQLGQVRTNEDKQKIQTSISLTKSLISQINTHLNEPVPPALQISAEYFYFHGNILFKLKKNQEAFDQYKEAVKIDPQHTNAYNNLINLFLMAKNYQGALYYVNQAEGNGVEVNPKLKDAVLKALEKKE